MIGLSDTYHIKKDVGFLQGIDISVDSTGLTLTKEQ